MAAPRFVPRGHGAAVSYGAQPPPHVPYAQPPRPSGGSSTLVIVLAVVGGLLLVLVVLGVLAVSGVRRYIAQSKAVEAHVSLARIGMEAKRVAETEELGETPPALEGPALVKRRLCASASRPVPRSLAEVTGKKYMSSGDEWLTDAPKNAGFACLGFSMQSPQYYQYAYTRAGEGFRAEARGDLDGDGVTSLFVVDGRFQGSELSVSPVRAEQQE